MIELTIINGETFQILEHIKPPFDVESDRIAYYKDRVCLIRNNVCYFKNYIEDWLVDINKSKLIDDNKKIKMNNYLNIVLNKMTSYHRVQTIYEILDRDSYYNSLIIAC